MRVTVKVGPEFADLAREYLENRKLELPRLKDCMARSSYNEIRDISHKMKGNGATYGFPEFSRIGGALEKASGIEDGAASRLLIDELEAYVNNVDIEVGDKEPA